MLELHDVLTALDYGQLHVIELGVAIGLLAATFYRSDHFTSYSILGLSLGIIFLQGVLQTVPAVSRTTFRIATMPVLFTVPMFVAFGAGVAVSRAVRARLGRSEPAEPSERPAD